jgi:hypothetical protein
MSRSIRSGGLVQKDPQSSEYYTFDWDKEHLPAGVEVSTSTFLVTGPDALLIVDQFGIFQGNRKTQVRLSAGTLGKRYVVTNRITTDQVPAQTKDASFKVLIQNL